MRLGRAVAFLAVPTLYIHRDEFGDFSFTAKGKRFYIFAEAWTFDPKSTSAVLNWREVFEQCAEDSVAGGQSFELAASLTSVKRDCDGAAQRNLTQHPRSRLRAGQTRRPHARYPGRRSRQSSINGECFSLVQTSWRRGRDLNPPQTQRLSTSIYSYRFVLNHL